MAVQDPPDPVCKAILLCQKTIVEAETLMVSLIGLFDGFVVGDDGRSGPAEAFCQITDADGRYCLRVEIQDLSTGHAIAGTEGIQIEIGDRLASTSVIIPIPPIPFPHPGVYDFVVFANGAEIDRNKFRVQRANE